MPKKKRKYPRSLKAGNELALKNRRLVFSQAADFQGLHILTYDELISEGDVAMLRAARQWPGLGMFSTYAVTCIRRAMLKAIKKRKFLGQEPPDDEDGAWIDTIPQTIPEDKPVYDLSLLTDVEKCVVCCRYGITGAEMGIQDTATKCGVRPDQVRKIERQALETLRRALTDEVPDEVQ